MPNRPSERGASESAPALAQLDDWLSPPSYSLSAPVDTCAMCFIASFSLPSRTRFASPVSLAS